MKLVGYKADNIIIINDLDNAKPDIKPKVRVNKVYQRHKAD